MVRGGERDTMDSSFEAMLKVSESCHQCRCGCCKDECPMYTEILEESISPKGRNTLIRALVGGVVEPDERAVRIAYSCLLCRRDEQSCTAELKSADAAEALREYLVSRGAPLVKEHQLLVKSVENYGNPWQEPRSSRRRWANGLKVARPVPGKTETLFYVGCTYSLDRTLFDSPRALAHLLECAGVDFGVLLDQELCCGSTVKRLGHSALFEKLRRENEERLRETGVRRMVTACSGCYKTLKHDYGSLSRDLRIVHSTEYLVELVDAGRLKFKGANVKVTYHDPCHLGRHAGVYDAPRKLLHSVPGLSLVEMKASRELSRCCGGGAGVKTAYPEISLNAAARRIREAVKTGATVLVTACPFCMQSLKDAARATGSPISVIELSVFLDSHVICPKGGSP